MSTDLREKTDVAGILSSAGWQEQARQGYPHFVVTLDPLRVVWASDGAEDLFNTTSCDRMSRQLFGGQAAARPMAARLGRLKPGAPPHLERILLSSGFRVAPLTLLCKAVEPTGGAAAIVIQVAGTAFVAPRPAPASDTVFSGVLSDGAVAIDELAEPHPEPADDPGPEAVLEPAAAPLAEPETTRSADEVAADFAARFGASRAQRFVWQTDADGRLTDIGPAMAECLGATALRAGDLLLDCLRDGAGETAGRVATAMERHESWSGFAVDWPVERADASVSVVFGGAPRAGTAAGYRGFGIVHLDRVEPVVRPEEFAQPETAALPSPEPEVSAPSVPESHPAIENVAALDAAEDLASVALDQGDPASRPDLASADELSDRRDDAEGVVEEAPAAAAASDAPVAPDVPAPSDDAPVRAEPAEEVPSTSTAPDAVRPARSAWLAASAPQGDADLSPGTGTSKVVHLSTFKSAASQGQAASRSSKPAPTDLAEESGGLDAPRWSEMPEGDGQPTIDGPEGQLSTNERYNFDEIARTLSAGPPALGDVGERVAPRESSRSREGEDALRNDARGAVAASEAAASNASALLDCLPIGTLVLQDGRLVYANRTILDLLSFDTLADMQVAGGVDRLFRGYVLASDSLASQPVAITASSGDTVAADIRVRKLQWQHEPATLVSVRRSLDREVGAQIEAIRLDLQKSQASVRDLTEALDFAVAGIGFLDMAGRILSINAGAERLFGYDQREVVGDFCTVLLAGDQKALWSSFFDGFAAQQGGRTTAFRRFASRKRNGETVHLAASLKRIGPDKICILWNDESHRHVSETELDAARREAERSSDVKSEFLAKVSHEIRTPLNAILGFTEIIMDERFGPIGNERYKDYLKDIHASGTHVMSLVNDLLDLSRIEAGGLELKLVAVNPNTVVGESVATLQSQAHRERIIIRSSLAPRLPPILADERALRQIVLNLLSNAVKFNEPGGQVIVSTAVTESGAVAIRVRDTGLGMSEEEIGIAMKPFRQLATPKASAGSGLGLPLTKALVEASQASMTIKSRPREGTLVEIMFQRAPAETVSLPAE